MRAAQVIEIERTCGACPSQWEGRLDDDRHIYVHYRGGTFTIGTGRTIDDAVDMSIDRPVVRTIDADGGGWMTDEEMQKAVTDAGFVWAVPA